MPKPWKFEHESNPTTEQKYLRNKTAVWLDVIQMWLPSETTFPRTARADYDRTFAQRRAG